MQAKDHHGVLAMRSIFDASMCVAALALAACAGNGDGLDANGRPLGSGDGGGGPLVATFDSIQSNVFTPICTACHAGAAAPQGLRLDATNSYDLLVGIPSSEVHSILRVSPGDPDHSYLVQKIEGHASVGARMPLGGPYLSQSTIDVIRQWITDGAQRTTAAAPAKSFAVATSMPSSGDQLETSPTPVIVAFTRELDRTRIDAASVHLQQMTAADASALDGDSVALDVRVPDANPRALVITPRIPLAAGRYTVRVDAAALADLSGASLPGDGAVEITFDVGANR
jgi:hypothetical protein